MSVLSVQSVSYSYKTKYQTVQAVKDVSCDLSAGTLYALVGFKGYMTFSQTVISGNKL
mgnify:CR=1 FL=1